MPAPDLRLIDRLRPIRRWLTRGDASMIRWLGATPVSAVLRRPVLTLGTTGRRSGRRRLVPLACVDVGDGWIISGGAGGQRAVPDWVVNLQASPKATVWYRRRRFDVVAEFPDGVAREPVYDLVLERFPQVRRYEQRSGRCLPVVVLRRRDGRMSESDGSPRHVAVRRRGSRQRSGRR